MTLPGGEVESSARIAAIGLRTPSLTRAAALDSSVDRGGLSRGFEDVVRERDDRERRVVLFVAEPVPFERPGEEAKARRRCLTFRP